MRRRLSNTKGANLTRTASNFKRRVALLGAGYIADWHARCITSVSDVELVSVCDRILPRAHTLAGKFGIDKTYDSLDAMLAAENLYAVHVLLPADQHFQAARKILEAGVNVFLEKPMCDRADDCDTLVRMAAERGLRLGVAHNFLFSEPYEQLRSDVSSGVLGPIDQVTITWNRELPQLTHGPFDIWMLREPQNILIEIGAHLVAQMLDLVGGPESLTVHASDSVTLPTGSKFYRRWRCNLFQGRTAVELRFAFGRGFDEYSIHVRGLLASATVDFERNTYTLQQHRPSGLDFDRYAMVMAQAKGLKQQARRTLLNYLLSKLRLRARGSAYGESIARAMDAFYSPLALDERVDGRTGAKVVRLCEQMGAAANLPPEPAISARPSLISTPRILVLGGTGFIGKELVRQLMAAGHAVRLLVRSAANVPAEMQCQVGDLNNKDDLLRAMEGVECVVHLARANVKSWTEYEEFEIEATRRVAECALQAGVKRLVYTGTIDSYYAGAGAGTITEETPLDPHINRRNLYARAKAVSEKILMSMHHEQALPVVIVRPGIVIGRGGSPFHWGVGMWWHESVCQIWGRGENKLPLVLVEDVAKGLMAAMEKPGIEGRAFNFIGDPCLSTQEYLDELDRCGGMRIQRSATPIYRFYLTDLMKWVVKVAVRHPERRFPSYRDWESRTQRAHFDCTAAKTVLGWQPVSGREDLVRKGIEEALIEWMK